VVSEIVYSFGVVFDSLFIIFVLES